MHVVCDGSFCLAIASPRGLVSIHRLMGIRATATRRRLGLYRRSRVSRYANEFFAKLALFDAVLLSATCRHLTSSGMVFGIVFEKFSKRFPKRTTPLQQGQDTCRATTTTVDGHRKNPTP